MLLVLLLVKEVVVVCHFYDDCKTCICLQKLGVLNFEACKLCLFWLRQLFFVFVALRVRDGGEGVWRERKFRR